MEFIKNNLSSLLAAIAALMAFTRLDRFFRFAAVQVVLAAVVQLLGLYIKDVGRTGNNNLLFNAYLPVEGLLLLAAVRYFLRGAGAMSRSLLYTGVVLFAAVSAISIAWSPFEYATYAFMLEQALLLGWYLYAIYRAEYLKLPARRAVFWFCGAIVLYAASSIPYYSLMPYLIKHFSGLSRQLFYINIIVSNVSNLFILIAFLHFFTKPYKHLSGGQWNNSLQ